MLSKYLYAAIAALVVLILIFFASRFGLHWLPDLGVVDPSQSPTPETLAVRLSAIDQLVNMMTNVCMGLAVVVGFALRPGAEHRFAFGVIDYVVGLAFAGCLFMSIFFGYGVRLKAIELVVFGGQGAWLALRSGISSQAIAVSLCAACAFFLVVRSFSEQTTVRS
jgi:hypothetical protein